MIQQLLQKINKEAHNKLIRNFLEPENKISILSKGQFKTILSHLDINNDNVELFKEYVFISILNSDELGDNIGYFKDNKSNVLILNFDDVINPERGQLFTKEQANEVIDFIFDNKQNILNGKCVIHCSAGVSRSGAIGTYINRFFEFDIKLFKYYNPNIDPNELVLKLLINQ